jgi:cobalt/nickel transport system permease protein
MHIPENYLSPSTCGVLGVAMLPVWAAAIKKTSEQVPREKMPLLGVAAAFCFLSMMFNIPLPGGTTGHAVCGTLIAILFGPWPAVIAISIALIIQAVFFGDGGILAIGANCFNMAFVLPFIGYGIYKLIANRTKSLHGELIAAGVASYVALNCAALCAAIEFGIQPLLFTNAAGEALYCPYPLLVSIPAMALGHLTVGGAAEAAFTVCILAFIRKVAPNFALLKGAGEADECVQSSQKFGEGVREAGEGLSEIGEGVQSGQPISSRALGPVAALIAILIAATPLGLLATGSAWGEWGAEDLSEMLGYVPSQIADGWEWKAFMPDYSIGALPEACGYILSAVIGVALLIILFKLFSLAMKQKVNFDE